MIIFLFIVLMSTMEAQCGPLAYAACQAACAAGAAAVAGGGAFTTTPAAVAAYSACQAGCSALLLAPTP
uniref:Uncharacterized protein n=1 Tax=Panagrolaimus superbus TaxID=310955 RepID=A0A914Y1P9_9BILA